MAVQRGLSPALRERAWFVSISLDPERDTPDDMRRYAQARGADLEGWSFLTGPVEHVEAVVRAYRVGKTVGADGEIEHLVASFLIDEEGRIARRYLGLEHEPDEIVADLEALANPG